MSEEEKNKKREYQKNRYHNVSEEEKIKKREYWRNRYHAMIKVC